MLPSGWNEGGDSYTLTYRQEGTMDIFLMKALNVDETVYIQLLVSGSNFYWSCDEDYSTVFRFSYGQLDILFNPQVI